MLNRAITFKEGIFALVLIAACSIAATAAKVGWTHWKTAEAERILLDLSKAMNSSLPKEVAAGMILERTTVERTIAGSGRRIIFHHKLTTITKNEKTLSVWADKLEPMIRDAMRNDSTINLAINSSDIIQAAAA